MASRFSFRLIDDKNRIVAMEEAVEGRDAEVYEFDFNIELPFDRSTSKITGYRQYHPFMIVKPICKGTPIIFQKMCEGRKLKAATISLFRHDPIDGIEKEYFNYDFKDVSIVAQQTYVLDTVSTDLQHYPPLEKIKLIAESVSQKYLDGNIEFTDEYRKRQNKLA
jgi:type VI secretion system secreted protein Hcp